MTRRRIGLLLFLLGFLLFACSVYQTWSLKQAAAELAILDLPTPNQELSLAPDPNDPYPRDTLFVTPDRRAYHSGDMVLKIPTLAIDSAIMDNTSRDGLKKGPGLYAYAQPPGEGNRNVSIAGHRDIQGSIFYDLDKLKAGDLFYLVYKEHIYQYAYQETRTIAPDNWQIIYNQGYSCLTLSTCTPIGVSSHRLVVTAKLISTSHLTDNYPYPATTLDL